VARVYLPNLARVQHAPTGASGAAGGEERICFVYKWVTHG